MVRLLSSIVAALVVVFSAVPASADAVADFYRGKTITCYIGYEAGGAYDLYARTTSKHISRHIPGNPAVMPVNKPGASSMILANFLAKVAPRDGTAIGAVNSALIFEPLFSGPESKAQFEGPDMTMIGNAVSSAAVLLSWKTSGVTSLQDLKQKELLIGATSRTGDT